MTSFEKGVRFVPQESEESVILPASLSSVANIKHDLLSRDLYKDLGLPFNFSGDQLESVHKRIGVMRWLLGVAKATQSRASLRYISVEQQIQIKQEAWEVLHNESDRRQYDTLRGAALNTLPTTAMLKTGDHAAGAEAGSYDPFDHRKAYTPNKTPEAPDDTAGQNSSLIAEDRDILQASLRSIYNVLVNLKSKFMYDHGRLIITPFVCLPPRKDFPLYYETITEPINMVMIENKIKRQAYASYDDMKLDIQLLASNAKTWNEIGSWIFADAVTIETIENAFDAAVRDETLARLTATTLQISHYSARNHDKYVHPPTAPDETLGTKRLKLLERRAQIKKKMSAKATAKTASASLTHLNIPAPVPVPQESVVHRGRPNIPYRCKLATLAREPKSDVQPNNAGAVALVPPTTTQVSSLGCMPAAPASVLQRGRPNLLYRYSGDSSTPFKKSNGPLTAASEVLLEARKTSSKGITAATSPEVAKTNKAPHPRHLKPRFNYSVETTTATSVSPHRRHPGHFSTDSRPQQASVPQEGPITTAPEMIDAIRSSEMGRSWRKT